MSTLIGLFLIVGGVWTYRKGVKYEARRYARKHGYKRK